MNQNPKILVVDDDPVSLLLVTKIFSSEEKFEVLQAHDAIEGLGLARKERPDLIISDYYMPGVDGFEFCRQIKKDPELSSILFLLLSSEARESKKVTGFEEGVDDYIEKPFSADLLKSKARALLRIKGLQDALRREKEELAKANELLGKNLEELISFLLQTIEVRLPGANDRAKRSRAIAEYIVHRLELPEQERKAILIASLLHEVGKIGLPESMIGKDWKTYSPEEKRLFRQHPIIGAMMVSMISGFRNFSMCIRHQLENYDGTGTPEGLQAEEIPLGARMLRALVFHGMLLERGQSKKEILQEIQFSENRTLDPRISNLLVQFIIENDQALSSDHQKMTMSELKVGMILAEDVYASSGIKLLPKGGQLQERTLQLLIEHHQADPIIGGVYVLSGSLSQ